MVYVVGHRGAAGVLPENTLLGFRYAIELGCDYVECDVHRTRDGHLVVIHDPTVDRTTNGTGAVAELDFATIRALDAGRGERVPTLEEVLETIRGRVRLLCELKGEGVEELTVETVRRLGMGDQVVLTSFHLDRLERVRRIAPELRIGAIFSDPGDEDVRRAHELGAVGIGVHYRNLRLRTVQQAHELGMEVRAWNPDTLPEMQAMIALGVDGISTNRPDLLIPYLRGGQGPAEAT
ncbi:MAG: glycerophosphoryl diester phosphodiesterase [Candidatus Poribacteria bacterium]|nr:MAG: glycerophosphoryl diester phosphodiesterase [Candidatus Poribacteria bacterium]